jgi:hypothetical protein
MGPDTQSTSYKGVSKYEDNVPLYMDDLTKLCPEAVQDHSLTITQKVQVLLNRLMTASAGKDQLLLLIAIRKTISGVDEPPVKELMETSILGILSQLFTFPDNGEDIRAMKLESLWILTNLAYGDEDDIAKMLDPQFGVIGII